MFLGLFLEAPGSYRAWGPFLKAPDNYRARYGVSFSIPDESFRRFENFMVKLSAKETNLTSFEVKTHPTLLETLISKYDIGPVKLPGLSRNRPLMTFALTWCANIFVGCSVTPTFFSADHFLL